jgi:hypothetical protein
MQCIAKLCGGLTDRRRHDRHEASTILASSGIRWDSGRLPAWAAGSVSHSGKAQRICQKDGLNG